MTPKGLPRCPAGCIWTPCGRQRDEESLRKMLVSSQYEGYCRNGTTCPPLGPRQTFAALKLFHCQTMERNAVYIRQARKKTGTREIELSSFRRPLFEVEPNVLIIKIQPTEGGIIFSLTLLSWGYLTASISFPRNGFRQNCNLVHRA